MEKGLRGMECGIEYGRAMSWRGRDFRMGKGVWGSINSRNQYGEQCSGGNRLGKGNGAAYCMGCTWEWGGVVACIMRWEVGIPVCLREGGWGRILCWEFLR
jgi:hypothetical protein